MWTSASSLLEVCGIGTGIILGQEDKIPVRPMFAGLFCSLPTKAFVRSKRSQTSLLK